MAAKVDDPILRDLTYGSKVWGLFNREACGHIRSQRWPNLISQINGEQYKPQLTGIQ